LEALKVFGMADDAIKNAEYDFKGGYFNAVANGAYYACYYCMVALLFTQKVYAKTHKGTQLKFSELFIKSSIFPSEMSKAIETLFESRQAADYEFGKNISESDAQTLIAEVSEIYTLTYSYFQSLLAQNP